MGAAPGHRFTRAYGAAVGKPSGVRGVLVTAGAVPAPTDGERRGAERLAENDEGSADTQRG